MTKDEIRMIETKSRPDSKTKLGKFIHYGGSQSFLEKES